MKKIDRILQCYLCRSITKSNKVSNLRRHIRLHGPIVKYYKCLQCGAKFQNKSNMKIHWNRIHKNLVEITKAPIRNTDAWAANRIAPILFPSKVHKPSFGETPNFKSNLSNHQVKSSHSNFGHIAFGSNLPSFQEICTDAIEKNNETPSLSCNTSLEDSPEVLRAVGLGKVKHIAPKCYGKKKENRHNKFAVTLTDIDCSNCDENFGRLQWSVESG